MAKFAFIFVAVFLLVQIASAAEVRNKRDVETTTANILDSIKTKIEDTFSEDNIRKAVDNLSSFGDTLKDLGTKVVSNVQNVLKDKEAAAPATP